MTAATAPRAGSATRLLAVDARGAVAHHGAHDLASLVQPGDVVIANDAATLPASLPGVHVPSGAVIEVRLAGHRADVAPGRIGFLAVAFGAGDHRTPTEDRPMPPLLAPGDRLRLGPLAATVDRLVDHPRLIALTFDGPAAAVWSGIARHGRPIQYAHVPRPLALWDTWTRLASVPAAFETPSAGLILDWATVQRIRERGAAFATLTLAAGLSSTGDAVLDARLPLDEPYRIPAATASLIAQAHASGGRVIAIGTTVVRALEDAALATGGVWVGDGLATGRIGPATRLRVVDVIVSGTHEPGTSHYELLRAFQPDRVLAELSRELDGRGYLTHEFGDFVWLAHAGHGTARKAERGATMAAP